MNDFFDKLGYAAKRAAKNVATEVNVAAAKQKASDAYRDLGKLCYQAIKRGETPDFPAAVARIDEALRRIEELRDRRDVTNVDIPAEEPQVEIVAEGAEPEIPAEDPLADITAEETDFVLVDEEA